MHREKLLNYFKNLNHGLLKVLAYYVVAFLLFTINRIVLFYRFLPEGVLPEYQKDLYKVFWFGSRFDTQAILYTALPLILFALIFAWFDSEDRRRQANTFFYRYSVVMIPLLSFLLICDQQYYSFFQSHYNPIVFGIFQDDTWAVTRSIWTDHPIIKIILFFVALTWLIVFIVKKLQYVRNYFKNIQLYGQISIFLVFVAAIIIGLRGSLDDFPLEKDNTTVSDHSFLNFLTPNAIFCLQEAVKDKKNSYFSHDNRKLLKQYQYSKVEDALNDYYQTNSTRPLKYSKEALYTTTPQNAFAAQHAPDVVFALMESMSNYYIDFHDSTKFNLLGSLQAHFKNDLLFRNFISDENGTIPSLEDLMIQIPIHPIAQTEHKLFTFPSSVALVYKNAGYETIFVTGGKLGWRNLDEFIPRQGFDKVASQETIMKEVKGAHTCEWGVYDEYLFTYIEQLLQKKGGKPKFIFLLSTTNHTPFEKPKHFKPRPIVMNDTMKKLTSNHPQAMDNFSNYQYSANCLGNFMNFVKNGDAKDKTIVAATGDHNNWMLFQYDDMVIHQKYGVPFYLYAPKDYLAGKTIDLQRFGSHKDIFPTLFHLSLSEQNYFNTGYDLLSNGTSSLPFFGANENKVTISASGAVLDVQSKKTKFLKWNPEQTQKLMPASLQDQKLLDLYRRSRARTFLLHYYFNEVLTGK